MAVNLKTTQLNSTKNLQPHHGFLAQRFTMAGSEALFQVADPLHSKLNMQYICWYNMVDNSNEGKAASTKLKLSDRTRIKI